MLNSSGGETAFAVDKEISSYGVNSIYEADNKESLIEDLSPTIRCGSGPWVLQQNLKSPVNLIDGRGEKTLFSWEPLQMHHGLKLTQCLGDTADESLTVLEGSWLIMCQRRALESVFSGNVRIIISNLVMPWEFANMVLVGRSCREKRTLAKLAAAQVGARWVAPELIRCMEPTSCFKSAISEVHKLLLKLGTPIVLYFSRHFSDHDSVLALLQHLIASGDIVQFLDENLKHSLPVIKPSHDSEDHDIDPESRSMPSNLHMREKLRIVISVEAERYKALEESYRGLLRNMSVKVLPESQENDLFAYCLKSIGEHNSSDAGFTHKEIQSAETSDSTQIDNSQQGTVTQSEKPARSSPSPGDEKLFEGDEKLLLVQILTTLHKVTGAWMGITLPQTKLDEALAVYQYVHASGLENMLRFKSNHERSLKHLENIAREIKKGNILIKECRSKIQVGILMIETKAIRISMWPGDHL